MIVPRMPRWIILAILLLVVLARSSIFIVWPESYFDADQAVFGLMAKHLAELRAFPLFMYGQSYILGVEAWMAAPLFAIFGPSATALKLPLLILNLVIAWLLVRTLGVAAGIWIMVQGLKHYASASGPGTSAGSAYGASNNILELAARTCISPSTALAGGRRLVSVHWPALLGTAPYPLGAFSIESIGTHGLAWSSCLPLLVVVAAAAGVTMASVSQRDISA